MARDITSAYASAAAAANVSAVLLWYADFPSGEVRICTDEQDLSWDGETWVGRGGLTSFAPIEESVDGVAHGIEVTLQGVSTDYRSLVLSDDIQGRDCALYLGLRASNGSVIASPYCWAMTMDTATIQDDGRSLTVTIAAENRLIFGDRHEPRRYTDADQQDEYPGDRFFEFVEGLQNKTVIIGVVGDAQPGVTDENRVVQDRWMLP